MFFFLFFLLFSSPLLFSPCPCQTPFISSCLVCLLFLVTKKIILEVHLVIHYSALFLFVEHSKPKEARRVELNVDKLWQISDCLIFKKKNEYRVFQEYQVVRCIFVHIFLKRRINIGYFESITLR